MPETFRPIPCYRPNSVLLRYFKNAFDSRTPLTLLFSFSYLLDLHSVLHQLSFTMATVTTENGYILTTQRIPDLVRGIVHTHSSSVTRERFQGDLRHWETFEQEVRHNFQRFGQHWTPTFLSVHATTPDNNDIYNEQLYCGNEASVLARFNQNVSHVVTSVAREQGLNYRFGDFKATTCPELDAPDVALIGPDCQPRLCGEAKAPWNHNFGATIELGSNSNALRQLLGELPPR